MEQARMIGFLSYGGVWLLFGFLRVLNLFIKDSKMTKNKTVTYNTTQTRTSGD